MTDKNSSPKISLVIAVARNGVIGTQNELPWTLPSELKRFREITTGHPVIMGRNTYESIGRALPDRDNIVVTRSGVVDDPVIHSANSIEEAFGMAERFAANRGVEEIMVIGGGQIYEQTRGRSDRIYYTLVDMDAEGDTTFAPLNPVNWKEISRQEHPAEEGDTASYTMIVYDRVQAAK